MQKYILCSYDINVDNTCPPTNCNSVRTAYFLGVFRYEVTLVKNNYSLILVSNRSFNIVIDDDFHNQTNVHVQLTVKCYVKMKRIIVEYM